MYSDHSILHDEIIANILSRLPAKVLCRFRCVSKSWFKLIKDPYFVNMHRLQSMQNSPILIQLRVDFGFYTPPDRKNSLHKCIIDKNGRPLGDFERIADFNVSLSDGNSLRKSSAFALKCQTSGYMIPPETGMAQFGQAQDLPRPIPKLGVDSYVDSMLSCCNLICLKTRGQIYVCNPSTHELLRLPSYGGGLKRESISIGFGYLPAINAYKVILLSYNHDIKSKCEVFTITDGCESDLASWRNIEESIDQIISNETSVYVNGALYWKATDFENHDEPKSIILKVDLERENFETIQYPPINCSNWTLQMLNGSLVEINGNLCFINEIKISRRNRITILKAMDIWILNDPSSNVWEWKYRIDITKLDVSFWGCRPVLEQDGELLMHSDMYSLLYYNINNETFEAVGGLWEQEVTHSCLYFDGLFSLKSGRPKDFVRF